MFAAMNGNTELIKMLIGLGAELDAKDTVYGWNKEFLTRQCFACDSVHVFIYMDLAEWCQERVFKFFT
jgi:hypothetical protein